MATGTTRDVTMGTEDGDKSLFSSDLCIGPTAVRMNQQSLLMIELFIDTDDF